MIKNLLDFLKHRKYEESRKNLKDSRKKHSENREFFIAECLRRISSETSEPDKKIQPKR